MSVAEIIGYLASVLPRISGEWELSSYLEPLYCLAICDIMHPETKQAEVRVKKNI